MQPGCCVTAGSGQATQEGLRLTPCRCIYAAESRQLVAEEASLLANMAELVVRRMEQQSLLARRDQVGGTGCARAASHACWVPDFLESAAQALTGSGAVENPGCRSTRQAEVLLTKAACIGEPPLGRCVGHPAGLAPA